MRRRLADIDWIAAAALATVRSSQGLGVRLKFGR
jgi:hypothetical protein